MANLLARQDSSAFASSSRGLVIVWDSPSCRLEVVEPGLILAPVNSSYGKDTLSSSSILNGHSNPLLEESSVSHTLF